ncbi:MAG TPA: hypothetical protein PKN48_15575 [Bacteroidales bacterium]|nr:hypothetical protein [Bacteroidales bacterium]
MKKLGLIIFLLLLQTRFVKAQGQDSLFHNAAIYTTIQWAAEKPVVTPQAWIYIDKFYLEARYNYENLNTASLYFGRSFAFDKKAFVEITPMLGGVVGETNGISPAFNFFLGYKSFSTSTQCQYTIDLKDTKNSFFWDWTIFYFSFSEHFGLGGAMQMLIPQSEKGIYNAGPMVRLSYKSLAAEMYVYNFWQYQPTYAVAVQYAF